MATPQDAAFAQGMFVALWPKVERCHEYVELLVAAQDQLQQTVDKLIAGLQEAEKAEGSSLVSYADRLRNFPARVEAPEEAGEDPGPTADHEGVAESRRILNDQVFSSRGGSVCSAAVLREFEIGSAACNTRQHHYVHI
ncbi:hypothetical protein KRP22_007823 [Phytophthora ramorum]|nr:hypothetical protein KRP22_4165 [Phytophthora ramorum]